MSRIVISDLIGPLAITAEDGQQLFNILEKALERGQNIELDFEGVTSITSVFLNSSIGHLYSRFSEKEIDEHLHLLGLDEIDMDLVNLVRARAQEFYTDPAVRGALEDMGEEDDD